MVVLEMVHHVCAVTLHLLVGGDCTEHNLSEALSSKHAEADPSNWPVVLDESQRAVLPDGVMREATGYLSSACKENQPHYTG